MHAFVWHSPVSDIPPFYPNDTAVITAIITAGITADLITYVRGHNLIA